MIHDKKTKDSNTVKNLKGIKNKQDTLVVKAQMDFQFECLVNNSQVVDFDWLETISLKKELNLIVLANFQKTLQVRTIKKNVEDLQKLALDAQNSGSPSIIQNSLQRVMKNIEDEKEECLRLRTKINKLRDSIGKLERMIKTGKKNAEMFIEKVQSSKEQKNFLTNAAKISKCLSHKFQTSRSAHNSDFEFNVSRLGDEMNKIQADSIKLCSKIAEKRIEGKEKSMQKELVLTKLKSEIDKCNDIKSAQRQVNSRLSHFQFYFSKVLKFIGFDESVGISESTGLIIEWLKNAETLSSSLTLNYSDKSDCLKKLKSEYKALCKEKDGIVLKSRFIISQSSQVFEKALNNNYENTILKIFSNLSFMIQQIFRVFCKAEKFSITTDSGLIEAKYRLENLIMKKNLENSESFSIKTKEFRVILDKLTSENDSNLHSPLISFFGSSSVIDSYMTNSQAFDLFQFFNHIHKHLNKTVNKNLLFFRDLLLKIKDSTASIERLVNQPKSDFNKKSLKYLVKLRTLSRSQPRVSFLSADDLKPGLPDKIKQRKSEVSSSFKIPDFLNSIQNNKNANLAKEINSIDDKLRSLKIIKKRISAQSNFNSSPLRFSNRFLAKNESAKRLYNISRSNKLLEFYSAAHSRKSSC